MLSFARHCPSHRLITRRLLHYTRKFKHFQFFNSQISGVLDKLVQFNLSDIGEGIAEVQLKEW
jgi:hypothetical protein